MTDTFPWFRYPAAQTGDFMVTWWEPRRNARGTRTTQPHARKFPTLDAAVAAAAEQGVCKKVEIMDCRVRLAVPRKDLLEVARRRDHEWGDALRAAFGPDGGQARYDQRGTSTPELQRLWLAKRDADKVAGL